MAASLRGGREPVNRRARLAFDPLFGGAGRAYAREFAGDDMESPATDERAPPRSPPGLDRRGFLAAASALAAVPALAVVSAVDDLTLFLCGDVMTGRGIDQILPHPGDPELFEAYVRSARGYVALAEGETGPLPRAAPFDYLWGDALDELERARPAARIANLEPAVTDRGAPWPGKGIHYRMHPANLPCLGAAGFDCVSLANNHVLDWGEVGLMDTLEHLARAGIAVAGAGNDLTAARAPAALPLPGARRLLVYACATGDCGVPAEWTAGVGHPGVGRLPDLARERVLDLAARIDAARRPGDLVVLSIHWGGNWGYHVSNAMRQFARSAIDLAGVDLVHGHSSHHPLGIEVHRERLVIYGCGDFLNDYEGIGGHESFRPELTLMYFPRLAADGRLRGLELVPMRIRRFRLERAAPEDAAWLAAMLVREGARFGTGAELLGDGRIALRW